MSEMDDLIPEFLVEAQELIERVYQDIEAFLSGHQNENDVPALLDGLFRSIHTIKGGSGMFNFSNTKEVAHKLEDYLTTIKSAQVPSINRSELDFILSETQKIEALINSKDQKDPPVGNPVSNAEKQEEISGEHGTTTEHASASDYIRVPINRINDAMNSIAEIFLIRNQMVHLIEKNKSGQIDQKDFFQNWDQLDASLRRGIGDIERSTQNMRMAPVKNLFSRLSRVIQSYRVPEKSITFKTIGEFTELDKKVLDALAEPLIHLVRNSMDHGIEDVSTRTSSGKPSMGTVTLKASIVNNEAIIEIGDDGKGIDHQVILDVAKRKGLDVTGLEDPISALNIIFLPGFSTAQSVTEISGRGVGMDAVKTSVQALGGKVEICTKVGKGTQFIIRLPVSVSVSPVVIVDVRGYKYAVPNQDIIEIRQIHVRDIKKNDGKNYVNFRGSFVECLDLKKFIEQESNDHEETLSEASLLFFHANQNVMAARVSSFVSNIEIIVKPNSPLQPGIPWISGVSVLPTGEAIFVLSLQRILDIKDISYAA